VVFPASFWSNSGPEFDLKGAFFVIIFHDLFGDRKILAFHRFLHGFEDVYRRFSLQNMVLWWTLETMKFDDPSEGFA
jgi:hypothetical protein